MPHIQGVVAPRNRLFALETLAGTGGQDAPHAERGEQVKL